MSEIMLGECKVAMTEKHKVLLLGGKPVGSVDIAKYLKSEGCKLYVADYLPSSMSPAKKLADVEIDVSTAEVGRLTKYVEDEGISAVVAGVHEFNIDKALKITGSCGLPYYVTPEAWGIVSNKSEFRSYCERYGIDTPKTIYTGNGDGFDVDSIAERIFPVIVKPVDNGANIGISICRNKTNLTSAILEAKGSSDCGEIIIEQFIEGDEVSVTYVVDNDEPFLVACGLKFNHKTDDCHRPSALADGYVYPAPQTEDYVRRYDKAVRRMISSLKLGKSTIFFQGIYDSNCFHIFEAGLRLEGTASFRFIDEMTKVNPMKQMVQGCCPFLDYHFNHQNADPFFGGKKVYVASVICKKASSISSVSGFKELASRRRFIATECRVVPGSEIPDDESLRRIAMRFVFTAESDDELRDYLLIIRNDIKISDNNGCDLVDDWSNSTFSRVLKGV